MLQNSPYYKSTILAILDHSFNLKLPLTWLNCYAFSLVFLLLWSFQLPFLVARRPINASKFCSVVSHYYLSQILSPHLIKDIFSQSFLHGLSSFTCNFSSPTLHFNAMFRYIDRVLFTVPFQFPNSLLGETITFYHHSS